MKWIPVVVVALVATACGSVSETSADTTTTTGPVTPYVVVTVVQDGGCMMMGPNCPTYAISSDSTVALYRGDEVVDESTIDQELVDAIVAELAKTDLDALRDRLPPGECQGCYDGIDTTFVYEDATFSGIDVELVTYEPLFAATWDAAAAASAVLTLPIEERS